MRWSKLYKEGGAIPIGNTLEIPLNTRRKKLEKANEEIGKRTIVIILKDFETFNLSGFPLPR